MSSNHSNSGHGSQFPSVEISATSTRMPMKELVRKRDRFLEMGQMALALKAQRVGKKRYGDQFPPLPEDLCKMMMAIESLMHKIDMGWDDFILQRYQRVYKERYGNRFPDMVPLPDDGETK